MQDAFGGLLSMGIIVFFLVLVTGILGFTYSYAKAFRMKDFVITAFEQYDALGCVTDENSSSDDTACKNLIRQRADQLAYSTHLNCEDHEEEVGVDNLFCYKVVDKLTDDNNSSTRIYEITTQVDIDIPVINNLFGLRIFQVHGATRELKVFNKG